MEHFPSSEKLLRDKKQLEGPREKGIDFAALPPGRSYAIPLEGANITSLSVQCSKYGKQLGRQFRFYIHAKDGVVEVGRVDGMDRILDVIDSAFPDYKQTIDNL